jgi:hypothetical protein
MRRKRGSSLIEVAIYSSLLLLVLAIVYPMYLACRRYFEISRASVGVQQASNLVCYRLNLELMESSPSTVEFFPRTTNPNSNVVGVTFLSARNNTKQFSIDPGGSGAPSWQRVVGYYLDADPQDPTNNQVCALFRAEYVPPGFPRTDAVKPSSLNPAVTTSTLRTNGINKRVIAHGVLAPNSPSDHGGLEIYSSDVNPWTTSGFVPNYNSASSRVYVRLRMFNNTSGVASRGNRRVVNQIETRTCVLIRG